MNVARELINISELLTRAAQLSKELEDAGLPAMSETDYANIVRCAKHLINKSRKVQGLAEQEAA